MNAAPPPITLTWAAKQTPAAPAPAALTLRETFAPGVRTSVCGLDSGEADTPSPAHPADLRSDTRSSPNALYYGDNRLLLARLLADGWGGRFRLIYADPPYNSGSQWARKVKLRGPQGAAGEKGGRGVLQQQPQYADAWDESAYLQFLYERLPLLRELLAADGSLWLHCDHRHSHHLRCLLEEVFGARNYLNTITWRSQTLRGAKVNAFYFANSAHAIHIFAKKRDAPPVWQAARKTLVLSAAQAAAEFMADERGFFRTSDPGAFTFASLQRLHAEGRLYAPYGGEVLLDAATGRAWCSKGGNIGVKYYLTDLGDGRYAVERGVDNIWDDIPGLGTTPGEDLGYPTQKTEALLRRIVQTATQPGDWVLDPFAGSGTTLAVAQKLGRRWVGCDAAYGAIQTARRRLYAAFSAPPAPEPAAQSAPPSSEHAPCGFAVYAADPPAAPPADPPPADPPPAGLPQVHLAITPIDGGAARIRVAVAGVTWPAAQGGAPAPADWRRAVDEIAIDGAYDPASSGPLQVTLADAPRKRKQLVAGDYTLPAPPPGKQVAVRVTDIWGQEMVVTG
jgi:DNA modification methylase